MRRGPDIVVGTPGRIRDLMNTRTCCSIRSRILCWTRPTACWTSASSAISARLSPPCRSRGSRCCSPRPCRARSASSPKASSAIRCAWTVTPEIRTPDKIEQHVHFVPMSAKRALLTDLLEDPALERVIVFTRTKHGANKVCEHLLAADIQPRRCTATKASPRARNRSTDSAPAAPACWLRPILPHAAST